MIVSANSVNHTISGPEITTKVLQNCKDISFAFGNGHCGDVYVEDFEWSSASPTMTDWPVWAFAIASFPFFAQVIQESTYAFMMRFLKNHQ